MKFAIVLIAAFVAIVAAMLYLDSRDWHDAPPSPAGSSGCMTGFYNGGD